MALSTRIIFVTRRIIHGIHRKSTVDGNVRRTAAISRVRRLLNLPSIFNDLYRILYREEKKIKNDRENANYILHRKLFIARVFSSYIIISKVVSIVTGVFSAENRRFR